MTKFPVLSICIPTFNRSRYLKETLESIVLQLSGEVEIVISDNASTDDTMVMVSGYLERHRNIKYSRSAINKGPDANFLRVVNMASGSYCWLLSDDDTLKQGAIKSIIDEIPKGYEIITFNETTCDHELRAIKDQRRLEVVGSKVLFDLSNEDEIISFFDRSDPVGGIPFGLISVLVFKKEVWDSTVVPEQMLKTAYVHVYKLLAAKQFNARVYYLPKTLINNRLNESYISTGFLRNFWVTASGYRVLAAHLFSDPVHQRAHRSFLDIAGRIYTKRYIIKLRLYEGRYSEWKKIERILISFGYSRFMLKTLGYIRLFLYFPYKVFRFSKKLLG